MVTESAQPSPEWCVEITRRMYTDAGLLVDSGVPYFSLRGRELLAALHHMLLSQAPNDDLEHLVNRI